MSENALRLEGTIEQKIARIDGTIMILRKNNLPYEKIEHLDKALTDELRLKERNETVRWKLFELRLVLDSLLIKKRKSDTFNPRRNRDSSPTIPLEVHRLRYG